MRGSGGGEHWLQRLPGPAVDLAELPGDRLGAVALCPVSPHDTAVWAKTNSSGDPSHGERFGIFVGLWAPTFFVLASQLVTAETTVHCLAAARCSRRRGAD